MPKISTSSPRITSGSPAEVLIGKPGRKQDAQGARLDRDQSGGDRAGLAGHFT